VVRAEFACYLGIAIWAVGITVSVQAAEPKPAPKAQVVGDLDRGLRQEVEAAVGEARTRPDSRIDARRRARDAAGDALALLRSEGYYDAQVEPDVSDEEPPTALLRVTLGTRFKIHDLAVHWVGASPAPGAVKAAVAAAKLAPGAPARAADVLAAEGRVVAQLQAVGYADASATPREVIVDHADHTMRPDLRISAGELVHLGPVKVLSAGRSQVAWVAGLAPWAPGAVYNPDSVAKLERRLLDAGVYESVTVALAPKDETAGGLRPVLVSLSDRKRRALEIGASYSTTEGSGIDGKWIHYNVLGRADTLTLTAKLYDIQQNLDLELDQPDWRRSDQILKIGGGFLGDITPAYDDAGAGVRVDVERHFTKTTFITVGDSFDFAAIKDKTEVNAEGIPVGVNLKLFIATLLGAFTLDRSNDPLDPTRGWRVDARIEPTFITGDRQLVYLKTQTQASSYLPFDAQGDTVLATRIKVGSILGGSIPDVPADRRFFAGGGGSVRGYGYQEVGPRLSDNTPEGGLSLLEGSFELRHRLNQQWGLAAFVDAGTVGTSPTPTLSGISAGVGIGIRYNLGFGPLRLDLATPLNPRQGDSRVQAYISIGQAF
jgi:translocation and assembly module TamA